MDGLRHVLGWLVGRMILRVLLLISLLEVDQEGVGKVEEVRSGESILGIGRLLFTGSAKGVCSDRLEI